MRLKPRKLPSQERLKELFDYNAETGQLIWRNPHRQQAHRKGTPAGSEINGYVRVKINRIPYFAHRIVFKMLTGEEPQMLWHINGNRLDNRIQNLTPAEHAGRH